MTQQREFSRNPSANDFLGGIALIAALVLLAVGSVIVGFMVLVVAAILLNKIRLALYKLLGLKTSEEKARDEERVELRDNKRIFLKGEVVKQLEAGRISVERAKELAGQIDAGEITKSSQIG